MAAPIFVFLLPSIMPSDSHDQRIFSRVKKLDVTGAILSAGAISTLIMAISFGGGTYSWNSRQITALFTVTGILWVCFALQQHFSILTTPENRLFPTALLKAWEMDILFAQMASAQVVVTVPVYFIPLYFQFAKGHSALSSGVQLLPFVLLLVLAVMLNGAMMPKTGYYMPWYLFGSVVALIGSALLYTIDLHTSQAKIYGYSVLTAFGVGLFSQAGFPITQVKAHQLQQAVSFIGFGQVAGITLALTISNSVFLNQATRRITGILPHASKSTIQEAILGSGTSFFLGLTSAERTDVLLAIMRSINETFILVITASALSLVLSCFMKREKLFIVSGD